MGVSCLIVSHSVERASGGMMYKVVVCARKQFLWSKRYVGFVNLFSPSIFIFVLCPCSFYCSLLDTNLNHLNSIR